MKIDNYITHLELRKRGLKKKYNELQLQSGKIKQWAKHDPYFNEITKLRNEIMDINDKLKFLLELRKGIAYENKRVQEPSKRR